MAGHVAAKAAKVASANHAMKAQALPTGQQNTTAENTTPTVVKSEVGADARKYPAGHIKNVTLEGNGAPNTSKIETSRNGRPIKIIRYDNDG